MSKRGQVTLFIILGLLLLILVALFFVFRSTIVEEKTEEARRVLEDVPTAFNPIKVFTEDCLKVVGEEGIRRLGQNGGYIKPSEWHQMKFSPTEPTDRDGVLLGQQVEIPYWYHNSRPNKAEAVEIAVRIPSIHDMERDVERWIEEELRSCVDDYEVFEGFSVQAGDSEAVVNILPGVVRISLDKHLAITHGDATNEMRHFYVEVPIDVLRAHSLATEITKAQQNYTFLEDQMLNLIALFSDIDKDMLMPMSASQFSVGGLVLWSEVRLKEDIKSIAANYVPLLRVYGAKNFFGYTYSPNEKYVDLKQRIYNNMVIPLDDGISNGIDVRFNYFDVWEPYFFMGCEGGVCQPQSSITPVTYPPMGLFGMQRYKGVYDISYPVLVSLQMPLAGNDEFRFLFAIEGNIRNNRAARTGMLPKQIVLFKPELLCDRSQRVSGTISVLVKDAFTQEPIKDVEVSYVLGESSCSIGVTDDGGALVQQFPTAIGGAIHAFAQGYLGSSRPLDTIHGKNDSVAIELWPYHDVNITVQKKKSVKCAGFCLSDGRNVSLPGLQLADGWNFIDVPQPLKEYEQVLAYFNRVSDVDDPATFSFASSGTESRRVHIPAGTYQLLISVISDEEFVVPEYRRCEDDECVMVPEIRFEPLMSGGLDWNNKTLLTFDPAQYYPARKVTLYATGYAVNEIPVGQRVVEDVALIGTNKDTSYAYAHLLQPNYE